MHVINAIISLYYCNHNVCIINCNCLYVQEMNSLLMIGLCTIMI